MTKRIRIDRLDLSLRAIAPATAENAARLLGPALAQALRRDSVAAPYPGDRDAAGLAAHVAGQLARRIAGESS